MEVIEQLGAEVFKAFGGIGKGLFEAIAADKDMADDLAFVGFEGCLGFCIERNGLGCGVRSTPIDGVAEELENIGVPPSLEAT